MTLEHPVEEEDVQTERGEWSNCVRGFSEPSFGMDDGDPLHDFV